MRHRLIRHCFHGLLALAVPLMALAAPATAQRAAPAKDWSQTVTLNANGAFMLGNPDAPHKLVEYLSYTCSHCSDFQAQGAPALKAQWVRRGLVSLEYRNFTRDPYDLTAALLARCGGASRFLANHEAVFANYEAWMKRAQAYSQKQANAAPAADRAAQLAAIAEETGLFDLLAARGVTPAAQRQCLADEKALETVLGLTESARADKSFTGTPYFLLNGTPLANVHNWEALRPKLPALPPSGN